jgi:hypothetical protein
MEIKKQVYKGIEFTIHLACNGDWGAWKNKFYAKSESSIVGSNANFKLEDTENAVKKQIDEFMSIAPKTVSELVEELRECLDWKGYEECELDEQRARLLINAFLTNLKG